jgi:UDP-galactopyranose mutase
MALWQKSSPDDGITRQTVAPAVWRRVFPQPVKGAPAELCAEEEKLLRQADLVFTGGYSLFEAKRQRHPSVHPFPSSVDLPHFKPARDGSAEPADQAAIPHPRLGFFGVLDERLDRDLLEALADARPDWQIIMVGPVVKIAPQDLPRRANIHYLGMKPYADLPAYLAGWDVALMPFAINESTRFISPTKTPEYLAGGRPVVSTRITDVVRQYGDLSGVRIADDARSFVAEAEHALTLSQAPERWLGEADEVLADLSWDRTFASMERLISDKRRSRVVTALKPHMTAPRIKRRHGFDYLIVGAGFAGSVLAERLASQRGARVMLVDRRSHIGGNAYDHYDQSGILVHRYGPHIFHTNSARIARYLSKFTEWRPYEHKVLARIGEQLLPVPINRVTVNRFFGINLSEAEVAAFLAAKAETAGEIRTSEDVVLAGVGRELYEAFFRGYTLKQWGMEPRDLDKSVTSRIPVRHNDDDRYFGDSFQNMPRHGYTRMFENMLDHRNIRVLLNADYRDVREEFDYRHLIYTGPVDEYFDYRYGRLPYRSLRFEHRTIERPIFQPVAVVNHPSRDVPYTRITEYKHLTGQTHSQTSISYEYPTDKGDPYYPVPRAENAALYARYAALADAEPDTSFVGRLATYRYYNMDQVVAQALTLYRTLAQAGAPAEARRAAAGGGIEARA